MVARVQFQSVVSSGTTPALTVTATGGGNLLVVHVSADGTNSALPTGVTLSGGSAGTDTLANDVSAASVNPVAAVNLSGWSIANCTAGHTTVTVTFAASVQSVLIEAWEVSGAAVAAALAGQSGGANPANTLQMAFDSGAGPVVPAGCWWSGTVTGIGSGGRANAVPSGSWTTEAALAPGSLTQMQSAYQAGPASAAPDYAGTFSAPVLGAYWAAIVTAYLPVGDATAFGAVSPLALAAPAGTVQANATVQGLVSALALAAPAGAAQSNAIVISGAVAALALAAPAGTVQAGGLTSTVYPLNLDSAGVFKDSASPQGPPLGSRYIRQG